MISEYTTIEDGKELPATKGHKESLRNNAECAEREIKRRYTYYIYLRERERERESTKLFGTTKQFVLKEKKLFFLCSTTRTKENLEQDCN